MAYIGRGTDSISNVEVLDNITFSGASSYTLQKGGANFVPVSANNILVSIDGVVQANNFSVSGSTIDFGVAIANTSTCNFVLHFGTGLITTVQDGAVTTVKIGNDAVTYAKLQNLATANRVLGSTSTGLIGETQIATAMVSDDAITYAKMQDTSAANRVLGAASAGTVGEVQVATDMIADAQVDESKLKISNAPTNGYFLSAQSGNTGGLTWAEAGGGGLIHIKTQTASNSSSIDFAHGTGGVIIDSTYDKYLFSCDYKPANDNVTPQLFISTDAGSSFITANYVYAMDGFEAGGGAVTRQSGSDSQIELSPDTQGNASDESMSINIYLSMPSRASTHKIFNFVGTTFDTASNLTPYSGGGACTGSTAAVNGVRFKFSAGNIEYGTFSLFGISKG